MSFNRKTRLLAGATFGAAAFLAASPASAQCVSGTTLSAGDTDNCGATLTTDTTGAFGSNRNQQYSSATVPTFLNVNGAITGAGLAWSPTTSGAFTTTVTNNS